MAVDVSKFPTEFTASVTTLPFASVMTTVAPLTFTPSQSVGSCSVGYTVPPMVSFPPSLFDDEWHVTHVSPGFIEAPSSACDVTPLVQTTANPTSVPPPSTELPEEPPEPEELLGLAAPPGPSMPPSRPASVALEASDEPTGPGPASSLAKSPQLCAGASQPATTSPITSTQFGNFVMPTRCPDGSDTRQCLRRYQESETPVKL